MNSKAAKQNYMLTLLPYSSFPRQKKIFRAVSQNDIDVTLVEDKTRNPQRIPYYVIPSEKEPGVFMLCYMSGTR